jgi:hypothetical protein
VRRRPRPCGSIAPTRRVEAADDIARMQTGGRHADRS